MEFLELVRNRYSCKKFDGRQVGEKELEMILEAGRLAPTAKNLQEQRIYVIQSQEGLTKLDNITPCRYGAGTVLVVAFDKNHVFTYPGEKRNSGVEDATIVATHMLLAEPFRSGGCGQGAGTAGKRRGAYAVGFGIPGGGNRASA